MGTIELRGLSRAFADTVAVDAVDLTIDDGEFLVLLGPSGCGKTTLLRMIAGLIEPTSGRIVLDGSDITEEPSRRRDLAMVFQSYALYPHLTVAKNLGFPLRVRRMDKQAIAERVAEVADVLEIGHLLGRRPKQLSGGQRQRVAVGRALVRSPSAFLMDEPLSNLDAKLRTGTRQELTALHRRLGATFVYVTHDQVEAMTMATRIAVLDAGRLEQVGTPEEVYDRPASVFVAGFLGSPEMNLVRGHVSGSGTDVVLTADGIAGTLWAGQTPELEVTVGIRPEHWRIGTPDPALRGVSAEGVVTSVENLGSDEIVYCLVGGTKLAVRAPRDEPTSIGDVVTLWVGAERVHLFDGTTGRRLEWLTEDQTSGVPTELTTL